MTIPKIAVLATGLVAAVVVATINPVPAQAFPTKAANCSGCHAVGGSTTAVPSTLNPAAGATYTVAITLAANPAGGNSGYAIVPVAPAVEKTNGGNTSSALSYSATMTAPTAAGKYTYNVYTNQGLTDPDGYASGTTYSITVAPAGPVVVTTATALAVSPVSPVVAPASPTLTATVAGAGAAGSVEFFNGATSLGTSPVASGTATKALTALAAANYSYTAVFTPTNVALFSASTSPAVAYVVTVPVPAAVTTTTALVVSPASPVEAPGNPTLTATVTGAGAAGTVEFFNGTTTLGTSPVAAGVATKALSGIAAGSYSYTAKFIPTSAAAFTPSTSLVSTYVVTAAPPVVIVPVASFTAAVSGLAVAMRDTSTNAPTSWSWDLGNGTTSTVQNPSVTYAAAGIYTVVLTATNSAGSNSVTKTVTVSDSTPLPSAAFIRHLSTDEGHVGNKVTIDGTGFGTPGVVQFGTATAKVVSWSATRIVVIVPSINSVAVHSESDSRTPVWYRHDQEVRVTVTPAGSAASNGVEFDVKSSSHHDD
jgi:PKD repeat protein